MCCVDRLSRQGKPDIPSPFLATKGLATVTKVRQVTLVKRPFSRQRSHAYASTVAFGPEKEKSTARDASTSSAKQTLQTIMTLRLVR